MWSYYGSKTNLVDYYPKPTHRMIIEPFAGSARYSLKHFECDVLLIDKYPVIVKIWKWLQLCSPGDILKLPRFTVGQTVNDFTFDCEEAKLFMGFIIGCGAERPRIKGTNRKIVERPNHVNYSLKRIANQLWKIRHWIIQEGSYTMAPETKATWFIDPPYQWGGGCLRLQQSRFKLLRTCRVVPVKKRTGTCMREYKGNVDELSSGRNHARKSEVFDRSHLDKFQNSLSE